MTDVLDVVLEVGESALECGRSSVPNVDLLAPHVEFEGAHGRDETATSGLSPHARHLMLKNFSAPRFEPKPGLGDHHIGKT